MARNNSHQDDVVSIVVVEADPAAAARLAHTLGGDQAVTQAQDVDELEALLGGQRTVAILGPSNAVAAELDAAEQLLQRRPELGCVLVADRLTTRVLQTALRAGLRDVVRMADAEDELPEVVARVAGSTAAPTIEPSEPARVITVFSTKGGAGKSVVATNLAVALTKRAEGPVVLVDADLQFGDVAVMLQMTPQYTVVDAVSAGERVDRAMLQGLLSRHESGVLVLAAPPEPAFADQVTPNDMINLIRVLREMASYVVVDTPSAFNDLVLSLIEESDDVLMVGALDIPSIKNVKLGLQTLRLLNVPAGKLHFVLNRANSKVRLDVAEVERALQLKADGFIPSDVMVPRTVNRGVPAVIDAPKSEVAKSFERLADLFATQPVASRRR